MHDFDRLRGFVGSPAAIALCDLPWLPIYIAIAFMFHRDLGLLAVAGVLVLVLLTALGNQLAQEPARQASGAHARRARLFETATRNAETITGLGMRSAFVRLFATRDAELRTAVQACGRQHGLVRRHVERHQAASCSRLRWRLAPISPSETRSRPA